MISSFMKIKGISLSLVLKGISSDLKDIPTCINFLNRSNSRWKVGDGKFVSSGMINDGKTMC